MKKKLVILIVILICLLIAVGIMYALDINRMKNNKPVLFSTWGYDYTPPVNLDGNQINKVISEYILNKNTTTRHENEKWFTSFKTYLVSEKEDNITIVYAWVLEESYYKKDNEIVLNNGSSIPYKFTLKKNEQNYEVLNHQIPRDGTYYSEDMKAMFPNDVLQNMDKIYDYGTIDNLKADIKEQVNIYFRNIEDEYSNFIKDISSSFVGTILEETTTYMIVEPNEDEDERKSADKIQINYGTDHIDYLYGVGRKVLILYKGYIMETYPAQINTDNILTDGYTDFEIIVKESKNVNKKKILNNSDLHKNNSKFDLYYYGLDEINVKVDNKTISLEDALKTGKITLSGLISKVNQDLEDKKITGDMYKDGGSMIYKYDTYTIIKFHTLEGNRDVYIGIPGMNINIDAYCQ